MNDSDTGYVFRRPGDSGEVSVYFFGNWTGYSHPVRPVEPIPYRETQRRAGYYEAWMDESSGRDLFVRFDGIRLERKEVDASPPGPLPGSGEAFFAPASPSSDAGPGRRVELDETVALNRYFRASLHEGRPRLEAVSKRRVLRFDYEYDDAGALTTIRVTNVEGRTEVHRLKT